MDSAPAVRLATDSPSEPTASDADPVDWVRRVDVNATPIELEVDLEPATPPAPRCLQDAETCYPIVLAHGIMANPAFIEFYGVADHLRAQGHFVYEATVEPFDSVEVRGRMLASQIEGIVAALGVDKVNVIAHSMGGLDARYAISTMGVGDKVASLTTISTPHRGSGAADALLDEPLIDDNSAIINVVLAGIATQFKGDVAKDPRLRAALEGLAEASAPAFNAANPDDSSVVYESWAGVSNMFGVNRPDDDEACENTIWNDNGENDILDAIFIATAPLVAHGGDRLPNDGMVTVESAKWGTFRGCIRADHSDEVGQFEDNAPDEKTGFDHLEFYEFLADDLAARGF